MVVQFVVLVPWRPLMLTMFLLVLYFFVFILIFDCRLCFRLPSSLTNSAQHHSILKYGARSFSILFVCLWFCFLPLSSAFDLVRRHSHRGWFPLFTLVLALLRSGGFVFDCRRSISILISRRETGWHPLFREPGPVDLFVVAAPPWRCPSSFDDLKTVATAKHGDATSEKQSIIQVATN